MINRENFKELMSTIETDKIREEFYKNNDYIYLVSHIFNVGSYLTINSVDYSEELEQEANENGDVLTHKDNLPFLLSQFGITL